MKIPEIMATDKTLLMEMLCDCDSELNQINKEMVEYIKNDKYPDKGEYFLKKRLELFYETDKQKTQQAMTRLGILLAREKEIINTSEWDKAYEYATGDVTLTPVVRNYIGDFNPKRRIKCPFHVSRQGGGMHLQVYEKTDTYHCFSCGASGDAITFVMAMEHCTFKEAVNILNKY